MYEIRRTAILELAIVAMSEKQACEWADKRTPDWVTQILGQREVWVCQSGDQVVGWASATGNELDGLYTDPRYVRQGVASLLLASVEAALSDRSYRSIELEASANAETFYRSRGYQAVAKTEPSGLTRFKKTLGPAV